LIIETGVQPPSTLYTPDWRGSGDVWEAYRRTCPLTAPARRLFNSLRASSANRGLSLLPGSSRPGDQFSFATELHGNYSFCDNPWAHYLHGHFFSDWRTFPVLFPIFSPSKAPGYSDIRVPSHYYYGTSRRYTYGWDEVNLELKEVDHMETPWERKSDKIFWRGATTGGGSSPPGFAPQYHRQRSVDERNWRFCIHTPVRTDLSVWLVQKPKVKETSSLSTRRALPSIVLQRFRWTTSTAKSWTLLSSKR